MKNQTEFEFLDPPEKEGEIGRLGPYRVTGMLGKGGMGQVFCAEDGRLKRRVALKVMNQKFAATPNSKRRFVEEARAMAAVHHDNVATIFEVGLRSGMPFIAMEMLQGKTLEAWNHEGKRYSSREILRLAGDVASGLSAAHENGIVHRDIKPANIWIEKDTGRAKILDFGLAIAGGNRFSGRGTVIGTPGYLSPEQARNEELDDRTDLYSLGVVLYQMCAGKLPLISDSVTGQMIAIIAHRPRSLTELKPDTPKPLSNLIDQLLEKEPRQRPRDASTLRGLVDEVSDQCQHDSQGALRIVTEEPTAEPVSKKQATKKVISKRMPVWLPWATGSVVSVAVLLMIWAFAGPEQVNKKPAAPVQPRADKPKPKIVRAASLAPLTLSDVKAGSRRVTSGDAARFRLLLHNAASGPASDPALLNAKADVAVQVATYFKSEGQGRRRASFPRKFRPKQLPRAGQSEQIELTVMTGSLPTGDVELIFELQTPGGVAVHSTSTPLTVNENLSTGDLLSFESLRTHDGGSDTYVGNKIKDATGTKRTLSLLRKGQGDAEVSQHVYLKFNLSRSPVAQDQIDRAVLLLTVTGDSHPGSTTFNVYGTAQLANWSDGGNSALSWDKVPSKGGVDSLRYLTQITIDNGGNVLKDVADGVRVYDPNLDDFLRTAAGNEVTIVLIAETKSNKPILFTSKEGKPDRSPALAIRGK